MATRQDLAEDVVAARTALNEAEDAVERAERDLRIARSAQSSLFRAYTEAQDTLDDYDGGLG